MELKTTLQGILIYIVMGWYLTGMAFSLLKMKKAGQFFFAVGFVTACVAYAYRWYHVAHWPLQNLFEVFLTLGLLIYPISVFCKRVFSVRGEAADMFIGFIVLYLAGFVFSDEPQRLPPALQSWLFVPHVSVYMLSYVFMAKAAFQAVLQLSSSSSPKQSKTYEQATYDMVICGFPLLTLGLILGSWWGKIAWGDYWGWDPKELWSLASWLVYVGYFHFRYMFGRKRSELNSVWAISGMVAIVITLLWVNLSKIFSGLHSYAS